MELFSFERLQQFFSWLGRAIKVRGTRKIFFQALIARAPGQCKVHVNLIGNFLKFWSQKLVLRLQIEENWNYFSRENWKLRWVVTIKNCRFYQNYFLNGPIKIKLFCFKGLQRFFSWMGRAIKVRGSRYIFFSRSHSPRSGAVQSKCKFCRKLFEILISKLVLRLQIEENWNCFSRENWNLRWVVTIKNCRFCQKYF